MAKAKFKISGMHCQSCATLIEEKIKDLNGVLSVKVSYDSQKAVIIYDEQKIKEMDIQKIIKEAGDYQLEKADDTEQGEKEEFDAIERPETKEETNFYSGESRKGHNNSKKIVSLLHLLICFSVISLVINFVLIKKVYPNFLATSSKVGNKAAQDQALPSGPQPNTAQFEPSEQASVVQFDITGENHVRGNFDAPITLVEFSDFECPFCVRHYLTLKKILSDYRGKVRLVYKHFPLSFHPNGQKAAEASECAGEQKYFWEYHDKLFENFDVGYSLDNFKKWAKELGLDTQQFNVCLDSNKYAQKVQADSKEGEDKGVNGTPATFINGWLVSGALPYESFKQIIDNLLNQ